MYFTKLEKLLFIFIFSLGIICMWFPFTQITQTTIINNESFNKILISIGSSLIAFSAGYLWLYIKNKIDLNKEFNYQIELIISLKSRCKLIKKQINDLREVYENYQRPMWQLINVDANHYIRNIKPKFIDKSTEKLKEDILELDHFIQKMNYMIDRNQNLINLINEGNEKIEKVDEKLIKMLKNVTYW